MKSTYSRLAAIASAVLLMPVASFTQTYKMTDGLTINTCGGIFYDDGGPGGSAADLSPGNYIDNKVMTETFCSCNGSPIQLTFTTFLTEAGFDSLIIYNGANILAPKIGGYHGPVSPGTVVSSNAGNCLTFFFQSDLNTNTTGWAANISCTSTSTASITASGPTTFCQGGSVTLTASSGTSYTWNTGSTAQSIVASTSGSYYVSVTNGVCSAGAAPVNVTVKPAPTVTVTGAATICPGVSTSLKVSGGSSYSWAPASSLSNPNISNPYASPMTTTVYSVTATGSNGCTSMGNVTVTTKPEPPAAISGNTSICTGQSATLTASGGGTYSWNTGATTAAITVSPSSAANYNVMVTGGNGCTASASAIVTVNSVTAVASASPNTICNGESCTLTASGGNNYVWSTTETTSSITVMPSSTATYSVQVATGSCVDTAQSTVTVNSLPAAPTITPNGTSLASSAGVTYQWYFNSAMIPGATNQLYNATQNGMYMVCLSGSNGCSSCSAGYNMAVVGTTEDLPFVPSTIFPNPSNGQFNVHFDISAGDNYLVEVVNAFGQIVYSEKPDASNGPYTKQFDLSKYGAGMYLMVSTKNGSKTLYKIIVN